MKKFNLLVLATEQFNVHVFAENFDLIDGSFVFICDNEIVCWTDLDGGIDEYSFKQLKSGRWILRSERGDDPKNRLHLRHLTGKQLSDCREHISNCYADLPPIELPQAVKRVRKIFA
jgi:hypothetical protein